MRKVFNLKKFREEKNLTQTQLAAVLGVTQTDISRYEADTDIVPFKSILALSRQFNMPAIDDFLNDEIKTIDILPLAMKNKYQPLADIERKYMDVLHLYSTEKFLGYGGEHDSNYRTAITILFQKLLSKPLVVIIGDDDEKKFDMAASLVGYEALVMDRNSYYHPRVKQFFHNDELPVDFPKEKTAVSGTTIISKSNNVIDNDLSVYVDSELLKNCELKTMPVCPFVHNEDDFFRQHEYAVWMRTVNSAAAVINIRSERTKQKPARPFPFETGYYQKQREYERADLMERSEFTAMQSVTAPLLDVQIDGVGTGAYTYSMTDASVNERFANALQDCITKKIEEQERLSRQVLPEIFTVWNDILQAHKLEAIPTLTDFMLLCSKITNFYNEMRLVLSETLRDYISETESTYNDDTSVEKITELFLHYGEQVYASDDDLRKSFPCNTRDLNLAKEALLSKVDADMYSDWIEYTSRAQGKILELVEKYKDDKNLYALLQLLKLGLQTSEKELAKIDRKINNNDVSQNEKEDTLEAYKTSLFFKIFPFDLNFDSLHFEIKHEIFSALIKITTFARGSSQSKAKKIAKALQGSKYRKSFIEFFKLNGMNGFYRFVSIISSLDITEHFFKQPPTEGEIVKVIKNRKEHELLLQKLTELAKKESV